MITFKNFANKAKKINLNRYLLKQEIGNRGFSLETIAKFLKLNSNSLKNIFHNLILKSMIKIKKIL